MEDARFRCCGIGIRSERVCLPIFFRPFLLLFPRILNKIKERRSARPLLSSLMLLGVKKVGGKGS